MGLMQAGFLFLLFWSACFQFIDKAEYGVFGQDPELDQEKMETVADEDETEDSAPQLKRSASHGDLSTPEAMKLPKYLNVPASYDQKQLFKPERGVRPLPEWARKILLASAPAAPVTGGAEMGRDNVVEILCHVDKMYVRIRKRVFKSRDAYKYLKLGTCPVNQENEHYYYFLYSFVTGCGFKKESHADYLSISNVLRFRQTTPVLREMPFEIPLQCRFPRFFHSYKVGFHPKLRGGTVFRALKQKRMFSLTLVDASGNNVTGTKIYTLGQSMYFEASVLYTTASSRNKRLYINKCFMTPSSNPDSNPKYTVVDNNGCMIDGKVMLQSKFLTGSSKMVQRLTVGAVIFKDSASMISSQEQYLHCEIFMGSPTPTRNLKACNYDPVTGSWKELYGYDTVCACCESTCSPPQQRASRKIISSHSWMVDLTSEDEHVKSEPKMKSRDAGMFNLDDSDTEKHKDFLNNWDQ
ncbi:zona pellucida sperm-binding protein 3 [Astatotilapia calliptera]|uniref:zona pellucida sperm-binding protein 3 n=1 Tax=Astatotilapia calliptera TaxID=8154 RepID=UPI000E408F76|nr:zona pellucida sperm-binding protein 3-like [Astatotilapia calliptera]